MLTVTKGTVWVIASCIRLACVKTGFKCFRISVGVNAAWTFSLWKVDLIWAHSTPYSRLPVDWCLCVFETYKQLIYTLWIVFNTKTIHHLFLKSINTIFICRWQNCILLHYPRSQPSQTALPKRLPAAGTPAVSGELPPGHSSLKAGWSATENKTFCSHLVDLAVVAATLLLWHTGLQ